MKTYPRFLYHKEKEPRIVKNEKEEKSLGEDWKESPADFGIETHPSKSQGLLKAIATENAKASESPSPAKRGPKPKAEKELSAHVNS